MVPVCRWIFGNRVRIGPAGADGRVEVELRGHHLESLAGDIAGLGASLEVLDPPELRRHLARVGLELTATYASGSLRADELEPWGASQAADAAFPPIF